MKKIFSIIIFIFVLVIFKPFVLKSFSADSLSQKNINEHIEPLYQAALKLYKKGYLPQAQEKFLQLQKMMSGYKFSEKYLRRIDEILTQKREEEKKKQQEDLERQYRAEKLDQEVQQKIRELNSLNQKEEVHRKNNQVEELYDEAVELFNIKDYEMAKRKFLQIQDKIMNFRSTLDYLNRIEEAMRREKEDMRNIEEQSKKELMKIENELK